MRLTVVTPIYNEAKSLPRLHERLTAVLSAMEGSYEIIAVDDGSTDGTAAVLEELAQGDTRFKVVSFRANRGQTAALAAGIKHASGEVIVTIDSDLENDPADIPRLLTKLDEGFDVVSGWRKARWQGAFFSRKLPSMVANKLISLLSGVSLHDYGCTLKAYRADLIKGVDLYGDMHRFLPAYAAWQGGKVAEVPVAYAPRVHGTSNYGMGRVVRVLLDLVVVVFMHRYLNRPMHFFGGWGLLSFLFGLLFGAIAVALKLFEIRDFVATPLPLWSALFVIVGVQLVMFGVVGEMLMRTYYESQGKATYLVKRTVNLD